MEGTRHERAALVIASYVIGFITAFILYANVTSNSQSTGFINSANHANTASVSDAELIKEPPAEILPIEVVNGLSVTYTDGKLEVASEDETNLLSFNPEVAGLNVDTSDMSQGFHYGEITYKTSPNKNFVFFCEKQDMTKDTCLGFVYDVGSKTIFPVTKEGTPVLISAKSLSEIVVDNNGLTIGGNYSANDSTPWILLDKNSPLDLQ